MSASVAYDSYGGFYVPGEVEEAQTIDVLLVLRRYGDAERL